LPHQKRESACAIFHEDKDDLVNYNSSSKHQKLFKKLDKLDKLKNLDHSDLKNK